MDFFSMDFCKVLYENVKKHSFNKKHIYINGSQTF